MVYDYLVIGAGIAGASVAALLADKGSVALLEMESQAGYHSTGRSAAIFVRNYGNAAIRALSDASYRTLAEGDALLDNKTFLSPRGILLVAEAGKEENLQKELEEAQGMVALTAEEAVALAPILRPEKISLAGYEEEAQDIDVAALHQAYLSLFKRRGGDIHLSNEVESLTRTGDIWQVQCKGKSFEGTVVVNAAGAWADVIAERAGLMPVGLQPLRRSAAMVPLSEIPGGQGHDCSHWPLVGDFEETYYFKPDGGKLMVSPGDEIPVDPHDAYADDMILAEGIDCFQQATTVEVTRIERTWAGLRTFAPDRTPVVGFDPSTEGFFWLAGQGGYGIQTSPAMAMLGAALASGSDLPEELVKSNVSVEALAPNRFR
ncbi:NAD(P)/FAD-dependent oxidoreductase [Rhodovibrionaceae bacterium A322]